MEFLITRDDLTRALTRVQGIVEKRSTTPILSSVLIQARPEGVRMVATDKAMTFLGDFAANVREPGEVAVDASAAVVEAADSAWAVQGAARAKGEVA